MAGDVVSIQRAIVIELIAIGSFAKYEQVSDRVYTAVWLFHVGVCFDQTIVLREVLN